MGLLAWLIGNNRAIRTEPDRVYLTDAATWAAFAQVVRERLHRGEVVMVVAYFPATLRMAGRELAAAGISTQTLDRAIHAVDLEEVLPPPAARAPLLAPLPALLEDDQTILAQQCAQRCALTIIVPEVHSLRAAERRLLAFAAAIPMTVRIEPLASLDDPLMARFSGPWVQDVLRKLGMREDEELKSPMRSRQIRAAQDRVLRHVTSFEPAESAEEWLRRNVPDAD